MKQTCDECGPAVAARVIVSLPSGRVLTFCNHHGEKYRAKLESSGAVLYDMDDS